MSLLPARLGAFASGLDCGICYAEGNIIASLLCVWIFVSFTMLHFLIPS